LNRLRHEERRRGEPYSPAERAARLEPVAERIAYHQARNAAARASHTKTRLERLRARGHPPGALANVPALSAAL
jgi:hypothetical protein